MNDTSFSLQVPGCVLIPDFYETSYRRACCDTHDACYIENQCTAGTSWKDWAINNKTECTDCNQEVLDCWTDCSQKDIIDDGENQIPTIMEFKF